ncbi:prepilin peptidase [Maricaulis sp.]|uniref:prepilin peptidase n=1 Tax=Maricaulis sp. TaxID=1486257 RepID=UPI0034334171
MNELGGDIYLAATVTFAGLALMSGAYVATRRLRPYIAAPPQWNVPLIWGLMVTGTVWPTILILANGIDGLVPSVFVWGVVVAAYADLRARRIPRLASAGFGILGLAAATTTSMSAGLISAGGVAVVAILLWGASAAFRRDRSVVGLGGGDIVFVAATAAWLGPYSALVSLVVAGLLAAGVGAALKLNSIPFTAVYALPAVLGAVFAPQLFWHSGGWA